tara:strand:- start:321 stop:1166 length:846 start_codon:yes stop_codon:yes gene_type:complete
MLKKSILVLITLILISCDQRNPSTADEINLKLFVFDCGSLKLDDISNFSLKNTDTTIRELFVPCYLVDHPYGKLIWDAGLPLDIVGKGKIERPNGIEIFYGNSLADQMKEIGVSPNEVDYIAISHMHWDHVGASPLFAKSTLLIQKPEYEAAFNNPDSYSVFNFDDYSSLSKNKRILLDGDYDVFEDGSVTILSAPGHTPGHQVLMVKLKEEGTIILSGDLYHFEASRELKAVPVFNTDKQQTLKSMDKIETVIEKENAVFWIEHSKELADKLKLSPDFYD